jgi:tRNA 2-selenouridine synthase
MAIKKILIEEFLQLSKLNPVLDVRSPGEYLHAHIPDACNLPLFSDEERKVVGTAYKQQSRKTAIKIGLDYFGLKMRKMIDEVETIVNDYSNQIATIKNDILDEQPILKDKPCVLVHCWRGGMRSAGVAWLLDLYGFKVYTLTGGYKTYRKWVRTQFEREYNLNVLGGYTGSGKTMVLQELHRTDWRVIDLERLANHKGSAFGALGENPQPKQEMFENLLAEKLYEITVISPGNIPEEIFIEDESQRIGSINIPGNFWNQMRKSTLLFLDIPFEERLTYLTGEYGKFEKEELVNAIMRIQKRLGGLETKNAINYLLENKHRECFSILLTYYDKWYEKGLQNRDNLEGLLKRIPCTNGAIINNTQKLIDEKSTIQ